MTSEISSVNVHSGIPKLSFLSRSEMSSFLQQPQALSRNSPHVFVSFLFFSVAKRNFQWLSDIKAFLCTCRRSCLCFHVSVCVHCSAGGTLYTSIFVYTSKQVCMLVSLPLYFDGCCL